METLAIPEAAARVSQRWDALSDWLAAPISGISCLMGWAVASALFCLVVLRLGGISLDDSYESVYSTWSIAHGQFACAFPRGFNVTAPMYPLISGGIAGFTHIGNATPFPARALAGPRCNWAFVSLDAWSQRSDVIIRTARIGLLGWISLMGGAVAALRTTRYGRSRWEPFTLVLLACLPPVFTCVQSTFHPEDLLAMGLALGAIACARRDLWAWAGLLAGLAVLSQQFTALVAIPLFVLAPAGRRLRYTTTAALTVAALSAPIIAVTNGQAAHAIFLGTGTSHGVGGALLSQLRLRHAVAATMSRLFPLVLSAVATWWVAQRLGDRVRSAPIMLSLVAFSLGSRLLFEQQIFEYYFMALTVTLVLGDAARGRLRPSLVGWLFAVPVSLSADISWAARFADVIHLAAALLALVAIVDIALTAAAARRLVPWVLLLACAVATAVPFGGPPRWLWQIVLVGWGLVLACTPVVAELRHRTHPGTSSHRAAVA